MTCFKHLLHSRWNRWQREQFQDFLSYLMVLHSVRVLFPMEILAIKKTLGSFLNPLKSFKSHLPFVNPLPWWPYNVTNHILSSWLTGHWIRFQFCRRFSKDCVLICGLRSFKHFLNEKYNKTKRWPHVPLFRARSVFLTSFSIRGLDSRDQISEDVS